MTNWRWKVGDRWVCRHCPEPREMWTEVVGVTSSNGLSSPNPLHLVVRQSASAMTFSTATELAEHYRLRHHDAAPGTADYLDGLARGF